METVKDILQKANQYQTYAINKCNAHYKAAEGSKTFHIRLGIAVIICSSAVGTSIFAKLSEGNPTLTAVFGFASFLAAALSALQTFLRYAETAEMHRVAAAGYEGLRRALDLFILRYADAKEADRENALKEFETLSLKFNELSDKSPSIPDKVYDAVKVKPETSPADSGRDT